jgi:ring-1,2-phenylacetyl-CoA epoxidase subunit PaaC
MIDPIELQAELSEYILALADDELILGHRDSQWCGHAPILEEDIAFANIALDEIGHAGLWYGLYAQLSGQNPETTPDRLVYWRSAGEFRCTPLVELPNGDWAFSILRQYLFDAAEIARLTRLADSQLPGLSAIAQKAVKEEHYHLRHTRAWVERLGQGSQESQRRMQSAWLALGPYQESLFVLSPTDAALAAAGLVPEADQVRRDWESQVLPVLAACGLDLPELEPTPGAKRGQHHPGFSALIAEMQSVARQDPLARW